MPTLKFSSQQYDALFAISLKTMKRDFQKVKRKIEQAEIQGLDVKDLWEKIRKADSLIVEAVEDSSYGAVYKLDGARQLLEVLHLRLGS